MRTEASRNFSLPAPGSAVLTFAEIPDFLEQLNEQSKELAERMQEKFQQIGTSMTVMVGKNAAPDLTEKVAYVCAGMFRYRLGERFIRFFTENDIVGQLVPGSSLDAEFACELYVCSQKDLTRALAVDPKFCTLWVAHRELSLTIMQALCAALAVPQQELRQEIRNFAPGEAILNQGDPSQEILVMISGDADVEVDGQKVGAVNANEIFGEIAYLTGAARGATVRAASDCMVQIVHGDDFKELMRSKPHLAVQLATTQASRIAGLNHRVFRPKAS
jgi:hypothetical protein